MLNALHSLEWSAKPSSPAESSPSPRAAVSEGATSAGGTGAVRGSIGFEAMHPMMTDDKYVRCSFTRLLVQAKYTCSSRRCHLFMLLQ